MRLPGAVCSIQSARALVWAGVGGVSTRTASRSPYIRVQEIGDHESPSLGGELLTFRKGIGGAT